MSEPSPAWLTELIDATVQWGVDAANLRDEMVGDVPAFGWREALRLLDAIQFQDNPFGDRPVPNWALDCDCQLPHHRWNCHLTPIWAQTIRELDTNPWTVVRTADGLRGTHCNRGPCCLGHGHDGRCRM